MKKLLLSTALLGAAAFAATAQTQSDGMFRTAPEPLELHASEFIGKSVFASEAGLDADEYQGVQEGWDDIGEINDVILTRDGKVAAVLVDIGGFLGMGEHQVAVDMKAIRFVSDGATAGNPEDYYLVMHATREDLETAPEYSSNQDADTLTARDPIVRDGFIAAEPEVLTAEKLTGASVYDANDELIGEVSQLVLSDAGAVTAAIIDVGGFLGVGEKPVSLDLSQIDILRNTAGDDVRVYLPLTKEELEAMPAHKD